MTGLVLFKCRREKNTGGWEPTTEQLLKQALLEYSADWPEEERQRALYGVPAHTAAGQPYFKGLPELYASVSHTGSFWICAVSNKPVGVDAELQGRLWGQEERCRKLAVHFFAAEEQKYVEKYGTDGFLQIWMRKEALGKYRGTGLRRCALRADLVAEEAASGNRSGLWFTPVQPEPGVQAVLCTETPVKSVLVVELTGGADGIEKTKSKG